MPHQCVKCNEIYADNAQEIVNGCSCGGKMFFFIKKEALEKRKKMIENQDVKISDEDAKQVEKDIQEIMGVDVDSDTPIILDIESIKIVGPGKYEIDIASLFSKKPLVYSIGEGKYIIDLAGSFKGLD